MVPVISIVGKSKSGKTTLVCKLIKELKNRGYQVASIKHDVHGFDIDKPGKDSYKHGEAGADTVVISSPYKIATIQQLTEEKRLDEVISNIENADIILTEGYKREDKPKIEVFKHVEGDKPLCNANECIAIACDDDSFLYGSVPVYHWNDVNGLVDLIEHKLLT